MGVFRRGVPSFEDWYDMTFGAGVGTVHNVILQSKHQFDDSRCISMHGITNLIPPGSECNPTSETRKPRSASRSWASCGRSWE